MVNNALAQLRENGVIRPIDQAFGEYIQSLESQHAHWFGVMAAWLSVKLGEQDSCISLSRLNRELNAAGLPGLPDDWETAVQLSASVAVVSGEVTEVKRPLVLDNQHLYLQRYWAYEVALASAIQQRVAVSQAVDIEAARGLLTQLFTDHDQGEVDWQKVAVCVAATRQLTLITGGPGTGKTTTVTRLLGLLQGLARARGEVLNMHLVAPTGKAAARLTESLLAQRARLPETLQQDLPQQCSTVHRLLGPLPNSPYFRHNRDNPLHLDVLVVDEASMVDLPLMAKLFDALPAHARVVLLGDKDQLASVETGSVLADICAAAGHGDKEDGIYSTALTDMVHALSGIALTPAARDVSSIADALVSLKRSRRYDANSGVGQLARAINRGDGAVSLALLEDQGFADIQWQGGRAPGYLVEQLIPGYQLYFAALQDGNLEHAFHAMRGQQVLCAQRRGEWGVYNLNHLIEGRLHRLGLIDNQLEFYPGRPVMLTQNDHQARLYNGDIGIVMPDPQRPDLIKVWFETPEGQVRGVLPSRLPPHETLYAMTIHKSQGSEFDHVYLCLPQTEAGKGASGLSRELVYTGLTRARSQFVLYADKSVFERALQQPCQRSSGLSQRLMVAD